ncbi:protein of unknown function [Micropruina glycogenica]|uniref:Uncharacterized protein n=1 Tax=Micropruina glycogenica TaxID=75385 RepID=A0A2N9JG06_9ACTN|nr:protein of unknown function [Micropruina glycogenica]
MNLPIDSHGPLNVQSIAISYMLCRVKVSQAQLIRLRGKITDVSREVDALC